MSKESASLPVIELEKISPIGSTLQISVVPQWVVISIGGLGAFILGYDTGIMSTARKHVAAEYGVVDPILNGLITSVILIGAMVGSIPGNMIVRHFGRKMTCFVGNSLCLFGGIVTSFSLNLGMFMVLRLLLGFGVGIISFICPLYVSETAPPSRKGIFGSLFQVSLTLGIFVSYIVGYAFDQVENKSIAWRLMLGSGGVLFPLLLYPIILFRMVEVSSPTQPPEDVPMEQLSDKHIYKEQKIEKGGFKGLCVPKIRITQTVMGIVLASLFQLTGINSLIFYGPAILSEAGLKNEILLNMVIGGWNFITTFGAVFLVERLGRRVLMIGCSTLLGVALIAVGLCFQFITDNVQRGIGVGLGLIVILAVFEAGPGSLFWLLSNEIFDPDVKELGASMTNVLQWLFNVLASSLSLHLFDTLGYGVTFCLFGSLGLLCTLYIVIVITQVPSLLPSPVVVVD